MTSIKDSLAFVKGAVASNSDIPVMTHFAISNSRISSYNGVISLSSPIEFDINCNPKAITLIKAINACEDQIRMSLGNGGKLQIKSGKFKAEIECLEDASQLQTVPEGQEYRIDFDRLLTGFSKLIRFVGTDMNRPFNTGILLREQSLYATNNVCLVEYWTGQNLPTMNIPQQAIAEILRIEQKPTMMHVSNNSASFIYPDGRWLITQLLTTQWPDVSRVLNVPSNPVAIDSEMLPVIKKLKPFTDYSRVIKFSQGNISASTANYDHDTISFEATYNYDMLMLLDNVVTHIDFSNSPKPGLFFGENLRGAIMPMLNK